MRGLGVRQVVVGRQPIFDRTAKVHGYELVFRPMAGTVGDPVRRYDSPLVTAEVLFTTLAVGIDRMVGSRDLYVRADRELLLRDAPFVLPPDRTVIEVDATAGDDGLVARCRQLRADGFRVAVEYSGDDMSQELLALATTVKLDVRTIERDDAAAAIKAAHRRGASVVVTNIDLRQELVECDQLGADLFQGNLLAHATPVPGRTLEPGRLAALRLASTMLDAEVGVAQIEAVVRGDPAMSHQLLSLAGVGAASGMRRTVRSVREALVLVGWRRLQSWVALLLLAGTGDRVEPEAMTIALVRARACELLAERTMPAMADAAFTAGLISALDLLLHVDLPVAVESLPLDPELRAAVLDHQGPLGALVADVTDLQFGRYESAVRSGIDDGLVHAAIFEALTWSVQAGAAFEGSEAEVGVDGSSA